MRSLPVCRHAPTLPVLGNVQRCLYNQAWDGTYGEIIGKIRVARDGKKFTMKFSYIDYNGDATVNYDQGTGVSYGTRLEFPASK